MGFSWATAESLPFVSESMDGISFVFSIHHMDGDKINKSIEEAKRVLKKDGNIFIAEDLINTKDQREFTEKIDRKLNWESKKVEHNYKSNEEWEKYFDEIGLEIVDMKFFNSQYKKGTVEHGFYILKLKTGKEKPDSIN